jgi:hypothetical protein
MGLSKKEKPRTAILQSFANANSKLVENYGLLATRDLQGLSAAGVDVREAELGAKFEEITRTIFEELGLHVDEERRKEINTAKDQIDIILSLGSEDLILCEVKSFKNGDYAKYSSTSRQVKSYVTRCETQGFRVGQVNSRGAVAGSGSRASAGSLIESGVCFGSWPSAKTGAARAEARAVNIRSFFIDE